MYAITNYKRLCTDRQTDADANMYGVALKFYRERASGAECRSSCSVLTPSTKKNIDSFRNGMGETNELEDDWREEGRRSE